MTTSGFDLITARFSRFHEPQVLRLAGPRLVPRPRTAYFPTRVMQQGFQRLMTSAGAWTLASAASVSTAMWLSTNRGAGHFMSAEAFARLADTSP